MSFYDAIRVGASGASTGYEIDRSLRFDHGSTTYMERTPSSAGNRKTFTISFWFKMSELQQASGSDGQVFFGSGGGGAGSNATNISIEATTYGGPRLDFLTMLGAASGSNYGRLKPSRKVRDPSAWYHVVIKVDTTQSTASNRLKMYLNGVEETDFSTAAYPDQNADTYMNVTDKHGIGANRTWVNQNTKYNYFGGYITEFHFLDGTAYDASYFGETDSITGQWIPKEYDGGNYGTNGFYLKFADNSGTTATTLGKDSSGNSNNYTPYNFSVSAGKDDDSSFDSPTNNFPTLNPLSKSSEPTVTNGNLRWYYNYKPASKTVRATMALPSTGKIYMEWENEQASSQAGRMSWGLVRYASQSSTYDYQAYNNVDYVNISYGGSTWNGTTHISASWPSFTFYTGERAALAIDCSNGKWWLGKVASNGSTTWYAADGGTDGDPAGGTNESATLPSFTTATEWIPFVGWHDGGAAVTQQFSANINFGNHSFLGTVPNGFDKLCSANLPDPTILLPNKHFGTILYTGDNTDDRDITDSSAIDFTPDWVWHKARNATNYHFLFDSVRGATKFLVSNTTSSESTQADSLSAFITNGFTVSDNTANADMNSSSHTYVAWNWNAGDTDGKTYTVTVVSDSGNKYRFDGFGTSAVTLDLAEGGTYIFNMDDATNATHPFSIGTAANGTVYTSGITYFLDGVSKTYSQYTSGFSSATTRRLHITVPASAPVLFYWCSAHSGMGGQINTNSTLGSSNFDGTIQSVVKANATAGFSISTYTGNGSSGATIGHALGVKPSVIICKCRNVGDNWIVYHQGLNNGVDPEDYYTFLNSSAGRVNSVIMLNDTAPTSSVITFQNDSTNNLNGRTYVMYAFSEVASYSKFGFYTGNGSTDGTFVFTSFKPALVIFKNTNSNEAWSMFDNKRDPHNPVSKFLRPSATNADTSGSNDIDFLSNGFKTRTTNNPNSSGATYVYLAFAESPFKNSRAR